MKLPNKQLFFADGVRVGLTPRNRSRFFADGKEIIPATITLAGDRTFTINVRGTNGAVLSVDYGDGSAKEDIILLGPSTNVPINHTYSAGTYILKIYGEQKAVTHMYASEQSIQKIDLSVFTNLIILYLQSNNIMDVSSLYSLIKLIWCRLEGNDIIDASMLSGMTDVVYCYLYSNNLISCSFIQNMVSLSYFRVQNNWIKELPSFFPVLDSCEISMQNNGSGFPTDECLEKMDTPNLTNNTINIAGTNPARTQPDTDAYVNTIVVVNGNSLTVNE